MSVAKPVEFRSKLSAESAERAKVPAEPVARRPALIQAARPLYGPEATRAPASLIVIRSAAVLSAFAPKVSVPPEIVVVPV